MHPNAMPVPSEYTSASVSFDDEAVCFHVIYPWKPSTYGLTLGEIERLDPSIQNGAYFLDTVEEVAEAIEGIRFTLHNCAHQEVLRRQQTHLLGNEGQSELPQP